MQPSTCKIGLIENFALFSSGFKADLEARKGFHVIGIGANVDELKKHLNGTEPDIILIDVLHCQNAGLDMLRGVKKIFRNVPLLVIIAREYSECFKEYIDFGTKGFVYANDTLDDLMEAIQVICDGNEYFKEDISKYRGVIAGNTTNSRGYKSKEKSLSAREIEILKLFCDGLTYREIGKKLFISHRTVETHKNNILKKLKLKSKAEMIKYATRNNYTTN